MPTLVVLALAGLLLTACAGGKSTPVPVVTPGVSATTTATVVGTPSPTAGPASPGAEIQVREVIVGPDIPMPEGLVLYYSERCVNCDGSPSPLRRVYRLSDGVHAEPLFTFARGTAWEPYSYVTDFDHGVIYAAVCVAGYCGGFASPTPGERGRTFRSSDNGASWAELPALPPWSSFSGILPRGAIVATNLDRENGGAMRFWVYPGGPDLTPPPGATWPYVVSGQLLWVAPGGVLLDEAGNTVRAAATTPPGRLESVLAVRANGRTIVEQTWQPGIAWTLAERDAAGALVRAWRLPEKAEIISYAAMTLPDGRLLAVNYAIGSGGENGPLPQLVLIDLEANLLSPMPEASSGLPEGMYPGVQGLIMAERFVRVDIPGDCLNIRARAELDSRLVACAAHGTLLRSSGLPVESEALKWLAVTTPAGASGWASAGYLNR